jgi:ADP-ribose pyrophosphatase YjhB (NUDIX family)
MTQPKWLEWAKALQSITQTGLHYSDGVFDKERYHQIQAIAAEMMAHHAEVEFEVVRGLFAAELGPSTPKIDVRGAVFKDDAILMVREKLDNDRWTLPGGWADVNETPAQTTVREIREESGYKTRAVRLLALYDKGKHEHPPSFFHTYKVFFLCEIIGGAPTQSIETSEVAFFREDDLPPDLSEGRITRAQLHRLFALYRHPDWPADFD